MQLLLIMLGGALGSAARHWLNGQIGALPLADARVTALVPASFPLGILVCNVLGCFALGAVAGVGAHVAWLPETARVPLAVGFLGAFTTYSTFALDTLTLAESGWLVGAVAYVGVTTALGLAAAAAGGALARAALG